MQIKVNANAANMERHHLIFWQSSLQVISTNANIRSETSTIFLKAQKRYLLLFSPLKRFSWTFSQHF